MTSLLGPGDYGIYALLTAFQGFCGLFLINPVGQHINRHTHEWWDGGTLLTRLSGYDRYIWAVSAGIAAVVVIWWLVFPSTEKNTEASIFAALAVAGMVYLGTWNGTFIYILNMLGYRRESVGWMTISSVIGLTSSAILAYQYHSAIAWIVGQAFGMAVGALGSGLILRQKYKAQRHFERDAKEAATLLTWETVFKYCLPLAAATGFMWMQNTGYRFWVGGVWGVADLGILAMGLGISSQLWLIVESLAMQFLHPYFFRHIADAKTDSEKAMVLSDMLNIMWPLYAVLAGFNVMFASSLLAVLTDSRYHSAIAFVTLGALVEFARCTTNLWSYAAQIQRRTQKVIVPYGLGASVTWLGAMGAAYFGSDLKTLAIVLAISGAITCAAMVALMLRTLPVVLDWRRWLSAGAILILSLVFTIIMPIRADSLRENILLLFVGLLFLGICMGVFLWRASALERLLAVSLRGA